MSQDIVGTDPTWRNYHAAYIKARPEHPPPSFNVAILEADNAKHSE